MKTSFLSVLKIRTVMFLLSGAIATIIVLACAGGDEDLYSSKVTQEAYVPSKYKLIGYSLNLYNDSWDDVYYPEYDLTAINTSDWEKYLQNSMSKEEIEKCLFTYTAPEIDSLKKILSKSENNYDQKRDFLAYVRVAKDAEVYGNTYYDWWVETRPDYSKDAINLFPIIERNYQMASGNAFMAERWWFQMVKNLYFQKDYERAIGYFNEYESQFQKNTLYYRVLGYKAGSYYKLGNYALANALYAKMLTANHAFLQTAHFSFHPMEEADFLATIDLCETPKKNVRRGCYLAHITMP
jgi:tetratricopeptide (TPR) repeat protein